jgi:hypothetical protein
MTGWGGDKASMISRDDLLENLYRLRCSCEEQLSIARKSDRHGLAAEVENQLTLIDEMIARSCAHRPV